MLISALALPFSFISLINLLPFTNTFCHTRLHLCLLVVFLCSCSLCFLLASIHPSICFAHCSALSLSSSCHSSIDLPRAFLSFFFSLSFLSPQPTNVPIINKSETENKEEELARLKTKNNTAAQLILLLFQAVTRQ